MGRIAQFLGLQDVPDLKPYEDTIDLLEERVQESMAKLELSNENAGWAKLGTEGQREFTREGLQRAAELVRVMAVANPLIKRGLALRANYVHGQGVGVVARDEKVNQLVQEFLDNEENRKALTGHQAKLRLETALGTDGNLFIALFTNPLTGAVKPRTLPFDEIRTITTAPGDRLAVRFYRREWRGDDGNTKVELYPDIRYRPASRPRFVQEGENRYSINWDAPVYHMHDNGQEGWQYGIGDAYAAVPWALAYKGFLEDWVLLIKALSQIAYQISGSKVPDSQKRRAQIAAMQSSGAGGTVDLGGEQKLEAVPKSGATIDSESGRPVATMAASALGVPVTMLLADPGQTGARAVADTLTQPTVLEFKGRQELWTEMLRAVLGYVIDQAVLAPRGGLRGTTVRDGDTLQVKLSGKERTLEITWPEINETPVDTLMDAIVAADGTGKVPPLVIVQLMLRALGVRDVDEILEKLTDEDGNFIPPEATAGDVAAQAFRRGEDPAERLRR